MNRRGIELALSQINARPERAGSPLQIRYEDDEGSGETASRIAQRFVDSPRRRRGDRPRQLGRDGRRRAGLRRPPRRRGDGRHLAGAHRDLAVGLPRHLERLVQRPRHRALREPARSVACGDPLREQQLRPRTGGRLSPRLHGTASSAWIRSPRSRTSRSTRTSSGSSALASDIVFVAGSEESGLAFLREARAHGLAADLVGGDGWSGLSVDTAPLAGHLRRRAIHRRGSASPGAALRDRLHAALPHAPGQQRGTRLRRDDAALRRRDEQQRRPPRHPRLPRRPRRRRRRTRASPGAISFGTDGDPVGKNVVMTRIDHGTLRVAEASK